MPPTPPKKYAPRKLLVAALGVASINYVAIACTPSPEPPTTGNLPAPISAQDAAPPPPPHNPVTKLPPTAGNLPAPPPTSGNLPAPPPRDAGKPGTPGTR